MGTDTPHTVELRWRNGANGEWRTETVEIRDTNDTAGIQDDEVRAQAEAALRSRLQAQLGTRYANMPGAVEVDSYRVDNPATPAVDYSPRRPFGSSILTFNINNAAGAITAPVRRGTNSVAQVGFTSDGEAGTSSREAYDVLDALFRNYGVTLNDYLTNPGILENTPRGQELRAIISDSATRISMGSDGTPGGSSFSSLVLRAREDARVPASARLSSSGAAANPDASDGAMGNALMDYISNPNEANQARLNSERARVNRLIQQLLAQLDSGNLDGLTALMDAVARSYGLTVAEVGAATARLLGANEREAAEIGRNLQALNMNPTDANARARAQQDMQGLQLRMASVTQNRSMIASQLQTTLEALRGSQDVTREVREKAYAAKRAGFGP
jgi:hypothetical protein